MASSQSLTRVNLACLVTGALWLSMHVWHGLLFLDWHPVPTLGLAALGLCVAATIYAAAPLVTGRLALRSGKAAALVTAGLTSTGLVLPFLDAGAMQSYANWPVGALGPLLAALAMRRRPGWALALALGFCALIVGSAYHHDVTISWYISMCFSPLFWLGAAVLVRRIFDWTDAAIGGYDQAERRAHLQAELTAAREQVANTRRSELRHDVIPLLEQITAGTLLPAESRVACGVLAARLRDDLRARCVLSPELKQSLDRARRAGTRIRVLDDRDVPVDDEVASRARRLIRATVDHLRGADVTYRISADGTAITLVGHGAVKTLASVQGHLVREDIVALTSVTEGDVLFVRLR